MCLIESLSALRRKIKFLKNTIESQSYFVYSSLIYSVAWSKIGKVGISSKLEIG